MSIVVIEYSIAIVNNCRWFVVDKAAALNFSENKAVNTSFDAPESFTYGGDLVDVLCCALEGQPSVWD